MALMVDSTRKQDGAVNSWLILSVCLIFLTLGAMATSGWALYNFYQEKTTVDKQVDDAKTKAAYDARTQAEAEYQKTLNSTYTTFSGPSDYGTLTFSYPKYWSAYIAKDGTEGQDYQAFLNPGVVDGGSPTSTKTQQYALEVLIQEKDYATVVNSYSNLVKQNKLTSSSAKVNGEDAVQLKGNFTTDLRGTAVIFKIRDKTVTVRTDADTFLDEYNHIVSTIKFNS